MSTPPARTIAVTGDGNVIGDGNITFVYKSDFHGIYAPLGVYCLEPFQVFREVDIDHFAGRAELLKQLDDFLDGDCGYFVIEAKAGLGKTAFVAWLVKQRGYIQHFVRREQSPNYASSAMRSLAAQLILACKLDPATNDAVFSAASTQPEHLYDLLERALAQARNRKIVLVIDGLDQAYGSASPLKVKGQDAPNVLNLPQTLPKGAYIIVSQRPVRVPLYVDKATTPRKIYRLRAESRENQEDMRAFLDAAAARPEIAAALVAAKISFKEFTGTLLARSGGVWIYLHYIVPEIEARARKGLPLNLDSLPDGIVDYYLSYWRTWSEDHPGEWKRCHLPLLATLAVAPEAMPAGGLIDRAGVGGQISAADLRELLQGQWCPFVTEIDPGPASRFQFYHGTLPEIFTARLRAGYLPELEREKRLAELADLEAGLTTDELVFLRTLQEATAAARTRMITALRQLLLDAPAPAADRRQAALKLIRLRWLNETDSLEDLSATMELVGNFLESDFERTYLADRLKAALVARGPDCLDRHQVHLLVYLAVLHATLGKLKEAEGYYDRAAKALDEVLASADGVGDDHRLMARIFLGNANILLERSEQPSTKNSRKLRRDAQDIYGRAVDAAIRYGRDPALVVFIEVERCLNAAYLGRWEEGEAAYRRALAILPEIADPDVRTDRHARVLETAAHMYWLWGEMRKSQRLAHYEAARDLAEEEIALLGGSSELAGWAHSNCGEYWLALAPFPGYPNAMDMACQHWQAGLDIARELSLGELEAVCEGLLQEHCPPSPDPEEEPDRPPSDPEEKP